MKYRPASSSYFRMQLFAPPTKKQTHLFVVFAPGKVYSAAGGGAEPERTHQPTSSLTSSGSSGSDRGHRGSFHNTAVLHGSVQRRHQGQCGGGIPLIRSRAAGRTPAAGVAPPVNDGLCCTVEGKVGRAGTVPSVPLSRRVAALLLQRCINTLSASANQPGWVSLRRRHLFCLHADRGCLWGDSRENLCLHYRVGLSIAPLT